MKLIDRWIKPICLLISALFIAFVVSVARGDVLASVCRISNIQNGVTDKGSGTLVSVLDSKQPGKRAGLVLTCAHLFADGIGTIVCEFPDGRRHYATLMNGIDRANDLAALEIGDVIHEPVTPVQIESLGGNYRACGFGGDGVLKCANGSVAGIFKKSSQNTTMQIVGASTVRSGDSGGGVFNDSGQLVGVVWGAAADGSYATYGEPLKVFLAQYRVRVCGPGGCGTQPQWQPSTRIVAPQQRPSWNSAPASKPKVAAKCDCKSRLAQLESDIADMASISDRILKVTEDQQSRLAALEAREPQIGPPGQNGKDGRDGKDAVVDIDAITAIVKSQIDKQLAELPAREPASPAYYDIVPRK